MRKRIRHPRRNRWQEYVLSKAFVLEHERERLCRAECQDDPTVAYVQAATEGHLRAARWSAGMDPDDGTPVRLPVRARVVNAWTGAAVEGAFVNLHAAQVVLTNLYSHQDIDSRVPDLLARMRTCMPAAASGATATGTATATAATGSRRSWPSVSSTAAVPAGWPNDGPGSATPCGWPMTPPTSCTPGSAASATC